MITLQDIAQHFGVSVATVSRALNGSTRVSVQRREDIVAYAHAHHFVPNSAARALQRSSRRGMLSSARQPSLSTSHVIGVIIPQFSHSYFASILSGIDEEAAARSYEVVVASSEERYDREVALCSTLAARQVCGIIVSQAKSTTRYDHFQQLVASGLPIVFYDRISTGVVADRVVVDDYAGVYTAVEYLIATGCRHIAYYGSPMAMEISKNRYNGWRDALLRHGIDPKQCAYRECDNRPLAEEITPAVLAADKPDAFFAVNDDVARGIMCAAERCGLHIPDDLSICGMGSKIPNDTFFSLSDEIHTAIDKLTTVEQDGKEVGRQAAHILIDKAEGRIPLSNVVRRVVRTHLVVRGSTRPLTTT